MRRPAGRRLAALSVISVLVVSFSLVASFGFLQPVSAQTPQALASKYAPVLHFTSGEKFYPTTVDYIITSSVLVQHSTNVTVDSAPTASTLGGNPSTDLYLNNKLGTEDAIAKDYASKAASIGYQAYVNVVTGGSGTVIQILAVLCLQQRPAQRSSGRHRGGPGVPGRQRQPHARTIFAAPSW